MGGTWTLELHELDRGTTLGTMVDWISSGVPVSQPEPGELAHELLAERDLHLFSDSSVGPSTHSRRGIGYVCSQAELIELAHRVRDDGVEVGMHPVALAASLVATGLSADAAAAWIRAGVRSPRVAQQTLRSMSAETPTNAIGPRSRPSANLECQAVRGADVSTLRVSRREWTAAR
ncbi:MAG: hypothetical protein ACREX8_22310 [Gammaproteobacteria bacterium]